jgi:hypothetical protein
MTTPQAVSTQFQETLQAARQALASEVSQNYRVFDQHVRGLEAMAREAFQAHFTDDYQKIVRKLEKGQSLTEADREKLKLLVVGEANYYLRHENDYENWRTELQRLVEEMARLEADGLDDIDSLLHMQALCRDARGVLPDITFYLQEQERLARFERALSGELDAESAQALADVIRAMMSSDKM